MRHLITLLGSAMAMTSCAGEPAPMVMAIVFTLHPSSMEGRRYAYNTIRTRVSGLPTATRIALIRVRGDGGDPIVFEGRAADLAPGNPAGEDRWSRLLVQERRGADVCTAFDAALDFLGKYRGDRRLIAVGDLVPHALQAGRREVPVRDLAVYAWPHAHDLAVKAVFVGAAPHVQARLAGAWSGRFATQPSFFGPHAVLDAEALGLTVEGGL